MNNQKQTSNKRVYIIGGIIVAILIVVFAVKKYNSMPARNPNNPMANVNLTWKKNDDGDVYLSNQGYDALERNLMLIMLKKAGANSKTINYLKTHHSKNVESFISLSDNEIDGDISKDDFSGIVDDHFEEILRQDERAGQVMKDLHDMLNHQEEFNTWIDIEPSKNLKQGETVQVKANLPEDIIEEYGIDTAPRKVKVQVN